MGEYIVREAVLKIVADNCPHDKCGYNTEEEMGAGEACYYIRKAVEAIPTADVAPKSEVERLQAELEDKQFRCDSCDRIGLTHSEHIACIKQAKAEIVREIFENIEKALNLSKCYGNSGIYFEHDIETDIAELKKKYTEVAE